MSDNLHKPGLYKWKRQTDPKVYSRSQKVTTNNDIQDWIKKVEDASNQAADAVFGDKKKKATALRNVGQLREHDDSHSEAQELLSQWVNDKIRLDNDMDDFDDEPWNKRSLEVKKEWDHLVDYNNEEYGMNYYRKQYKDEEDPYAFLADMDEGRAVDTVLDQMLKKKVVADRVVNDLGFDDSSKYKDPRLKMELRHKQVKEKREKHEEQLTRKRRDQQAKKEAQLKAKQMILKEDQDKMTKQKKEEMLIRKEMARIRKQMQEERRNVDDLRKREDKKQEELSSYAVKLVDQEEEDRRRKYVEQEKKTEVKQRILLERLNELKKRQEANDLRTLQRHFSAWYNLVLEKRLLMGKARAMGDWKLLFRAWNAWKSFVRSKKIDIETKQYEVDVVKTQRKIQLADSHSKQTLLRKYFAAWQLWVKQEVERKELEHAQSNTKSKMAALLEAAATGKLWTGNETDRTSSTVETTRSNRIQSARSGRKPVTPSASDIDSFFDQPAKRPHSSKSDTSTNISETAKQKRDNRNPTQPWQITRKHLNLTNEEIANMGDSEDHTEQSDLKVRKRFGTQPWMNTKYITNNFENRHQAQQKILQEQQKQLKEQQRIIEELQFGQNQNKLHEQLEKQQAILEHLAKNITPRTGESVPKGQTSASEVTKQQSSPNSKPSSKQSNISKQNNSAIVNSLKNEQENMKQNPKTSNVAMDTSRTTSTAVTARTDSTTKSNTKYLQTLKNMDERAAERNRLKAERDEKRRQAEDEKLKQLEAEEESRRKELEEDKRARAEAYREKKRLDKQKEMERQQRDEKVKQLNEKADDHYIRSIMKYRGLVPFKKLADMAKKNEFVAIAHHKSLIKRHVFSAWFDYVQYIKAQKEKLADNMYKYLIVKRSFNNWRNFKHHTIILEGRARRYHERNLKNKIFSVWSDWACQEVLDSINKDQKAREYYIWKLKQKSFDAIRTFPEEEKKEIERVKRISEMRQKVAALLPDFSAASLKESNNLL
ncbi:coiled-coil domain-containing protein 191-like [Mytilus trossulus]|uniref:coiled-coil domain-containing protein 191-like n=1 Tax=Mytilus trossulus TaxID=6551 RepID=UPI00300534D9